MKARSLLLISNSAQFGKGYLEHCEDEILNILEGKDNIVFIPYALADHDGYTKIAEKRFAELGKKVTGIHKALNKNELLGKSDAVFIGGGNTFRLLTELYKHDLLDTIRSQVLAGELVYMGASAGSNVAAPSIKTTNDMPIVYPPSFNALNLVPFQINPHYLDPDPHSKHQGETREKRIQEFHEMNNAPVIGLREGAYLRIEGESMELRGTTGARLFQKDKLTQEFSAGEDFDFLLQ